MSLATRCPACHTVFRVVQDQLRVSEGWVRCGQCQEVFNALETLFDLGDGSPAVAPETGGPPAPPPPAPAIDEAGIGAVVSEGPLPEDHWDPSPPPGPSSRPAPLDAPPIASTWSAAPPPPGGAVQAEAAMSAAGPDRHDEPIPPAPAAAANEAAGPAEPAEAAEPADTAEAPPRGDDEPTPSRFIGPSPEWARKPARARRGSARPSKARAAAEAPQAHAHQARSAHRRRRKPEFVRQAERAAFWRRPAVRAVLGSAAGLLGAMLLLQAAYQYRDPLAAQVPALAPALQAGCARWGCRLAAPRAIERIRLDASDLSRTEQDQVLRFTADLHNTADHAVRAPALDVSFTDALGRTVSRKVFQPAELGLRGESIDADAQWRIDARLAVGEQRIAGYTVEVFYP